MPKRKLSIIMAAAECAPFAKVGGLGDVVGSLPQALHTTGVTASVMLPLYQSIDHTQYALTRIGTFSFDRDHRSETVTVWSGRIAKNPVTYYFLEHPILASTAPYSRHDTSAQSVDPDINKFSFYAEAVVEAVNQLQLPCDLLHCHDWHASLIPTFVDQLAVTKRYPYTKTILTIHNLGNQGIAPRSALSKLNVSMGEPAILEDYYDLDDERLNMLKIGILSADKITTVSPTYAKEILTLDYGSGLESFLARRKKDLVGIVNGIDTQLFDPAKDGSIARRYTIKDWRNGKAEDKKALQQLVGLPEYAVPVYGLVSRLVTQKGLDILGTALEPFLDTDVQIVILGSGEKQIEQSLAELAKRFPGKMQVTIGFDLKLAQAIYAGADFFLMPSRFEPCGLGQLIAMRYGTVPIVRATGGLKDTVQHLKSGIVFKDYSADALSRALKQSLKLYATPRTLTRVVTAGMKKDFSWKPSAQKYLSLYRDIV